MTVKWPFERCNLLLFGRRRAAATARSVRACPRIETVEERTLLSSLGGVVGLDTDASVRLLSGINSQSPVEREVLDLNGGGSASTAASGNESEASFIGDFDGQVRPDHLECHFE